MRDMDVRIERLDTLHAIYTHALSDAPEEDAMNRILTWAEAQGLHHVQLASSFGSVCGFWVWFKI